MVRQLLRTCSGKLEMTAEYGCFCVYRLVRNVDGEVIKRVLVINTAEFKKAIAKMIEQAKHKG
ncbi:TPA: hypothetical protein ACK3JW_001111 [Mannheimia haemolytica]